MSSRSSRNCFGCFWSYETNDWVETYTEYEKIAHCRAAVESRVGTGVCKAYEPRPSALKKAVLKMRGE